MDPAKLLHTLRCTDNSWAAPGNHFKIYDASSYDGLSQAVRLANESRQITELRTHRPQNAVRSRPVVVV